MPEPIVALNEESLKSDLRELVRRTVEDTLNGLLEEEAGDLVGAERYERIAEREAYRAGHYERKLTTTSGEVAIRMPKFKGMRFATAIIERYRRREASVEEAMIEMRLAGASTRRIEDVSEILRGSSVSAATVSNLNEKALASVEERRKRPLERACPYVHVDGIYLKRSWGSSHENAAAMAATGVNDDGYREVIGAAEGFAESAERRREFLSRLKPRGLRGVRMFTGDKAAGMVGSISKVFPDAAYQRCTAHFCRSVLARVPKPKRPRVAAMLKAVHAMEPREPPKPRPSRSHPSSRGPCSGRPPRRSARGAPRPWPTPASRASTGGAYAPTTPSSGLTARSAGAPAWSERSPTASPRSCSSPRGSGTSPRASGAPAATWTSLCWRGSRAGWRAYGAVGKCARILTVPQGHGAGDISTRKKRSQTRTGPSTLTCPALQGWDQKDVSPYSTSYPFTKPSRRCSIAAMSQRTIEL